MPAALCEGWELMEQSQAGAIPPERIRYRLTRLQRVLPALPSIVILMALQVLFWLDGDPFDPVVVSVVTLPLVMLITWRPFGVTLTQSAAIVHNFRHRTIPWSNVQAIRMESFFGTRTVVIYEAGGRRTRLRAPNTGFLSWDRRFEEKFHTIGRWWMDHRGPYWAPVPPPGAQWGGPPASDRNPYAPPA
ncbi:hypothetical protein GCM10010121_085970 [Streptomyces brasiliensis]|uniref:PH domain-containing protein n=2 Tax=Streptomyces brasiliensis TaxID=1954 RepID=A0A917P578_9ACTN|nr:hypothetical protein GCM10010121_085970 [Streptomyces brasiliensis]